MVGLKIGVNDLATTNPELLYEWNWKKNKITIYEVSKGMSRKVWWKCDKGHNYEMDIDYKVSRNNSCPYCNGGMSNAETLVSILLNNYAIKYEREKQFIGTFVADFYFDFYINKRKAIIEMDGQQHFKSIAYFDKETSFKERIRRDKIKNTYCLQSNIPILRIPYTYDAIKDKDKIETLVLNFVKTREVPEEIIDFYDTHEFSNYSKVARELNKICKAY